MTVGYTYKYQGTLDKTTDEVLKLCNPSKHILPQHNCKAFANRHQTNLRNRQHTAMKGKGKAVPLQAWSGSEDSRKLRFPDFMATAKYGGKVVSLTHRPPLVPGNAPGAHFC